MKKLSFNNNDDTRETIKTMQYDNFVEFDQGKIDPSIPVIKSKSGEKPAIYKKLFGSVGKKEGFKDLKENESVVIDDKYLELTNEISYYDPISGFLRKQ